MTASVPAGADGPWTASEQVQLSWLWQELALPEGAIGGGPETRGLSTGSFASRWIPRDGFLEPLRGLPRPSNSLELFAFEEATLGPLAFRNVDTAKLLARYPTTLADDLIGGQRRYFQRLGVRVRGPLSPRTGLFAEVLDERSSDQPLGTPVADAAWAPRGTVNVVFAPTARSELTAGLRYDGLFVDNEGLSALDRPETARKRTSDLAMVTIGGRLQLDSRNELATTIDATLRRDDRMPIRGLAVPGHDNLDTYERWQNATFSYRHHTREGRIDARWRHFADGLFGAATAHTFTLGAQLERQRHELDETRTGGFTYVDLAALGPDGEPLRTIDEDDRTTWQLFSSDRGDEVHAKLVVDAAAAYLADEIRIGSRVVVTPGIRFERQGSRFLDGPRSLTSLTLSPRLGATADVTGSGAVRLWAHLGRFQRRFDPAMIVRDRRGAAYSPLEYWDWTGAPDADAPAIGDPGWLRVRQFPALNGELVRDVRSPAIDRAAAGAVLSAPDLGVTFAVHYEARLYRHLLGLYDPAFSVYDAATNPKGTYERVTTMTTGTTPEEVTYYQPRGGYRPEYVVGNPPGAEHTMHTVTARARVELGPAVLTGEVVLRSDRGNLDDIDGLSLEWRDPNGTLGAEGPLPAHDRLTVRTGGTFYLPLAVDLDVDYIYRSGAAYSRLIRVFPEGAPRTDVFDSRGRGGYRYPSRNIVDVGIRRRIPGLPAGWRMSIVGRNVLNSATVIGFRERATYFQGVTALEQPFEIRLGVSYDY